MKAYRRALALLELDRGKTYTAVAETLDVCNSTVASWSKNYRERGLLCLHDRPRSGRPVEIDGKQRAKVTALACSDPPEGYARWTIRLLADKAVELGHCEHVSHTKVRQNLKKRSEAAFEALLVYRDLGQPLFGPDGAHLGALRAALRPALSGGVL